MSFLSFSMAGCLDIFESVPITKSNVERSSSIIESLSILHNRLAKLVEHRGLGGLPNSMQQSCPGLPG
jgi:hypothetical protein